MSIAVKKIHCRNETLIITNWRAIFWEAKQTLILSDLHIGKTAHFRKHGIPVSSQVMYNDLERLKTLITHFKAEQLIIVGDLFHAENNDDVTVFKTWTQQFHLKIILVKGNHDRASFDMYDHLNIDIVNHFLDLKPFVFIHDLKSISDDTFYISGHMHPGVMLKGKGKQRIKLPCYLVNAQHIVLPAFSLFTGLNTKTPEIPYTHYAFTDSSIFEV